jgi:hypothetical protein
VNIRFDAESVRVRVTHDEARRLFQEGVLTDFWLTVKTDSPEALILERQGENFLFRLPRKKLCDMLETASLETEQEGSMRLSFEIDRFTF